MIATRLRLAGRARRSGAVSPGTTNLAAWWSMDETSGTRYDSHTGSYDITSSYGSNGYTTGIQGNAITFSAAYRNIYLSSSLSDAIALDGDVPFTVAFWVYFTTYSPSVGSYVVTRWNDNLLSNDYTAFFAPSGNAGFLIVNNSTYYQAVTSGLGATTGNWYFYVGWHDPENDVIGVRINQGTPFTVSHTIGGAAAQNAVFRIGSLNNTYGQTLGYVDEVSIWNAVLSNSELSWLYNSGSGRTYSEL